MGNFIIGVVLATAVFVTWNFVSQYQADMDAIEHEFEQVWESVNTLEGKDPGKAGEPDAK